MKQIWTCGHCQSQELYSLLVQNETGASIVWYSTKTGDPTEITNPMECHICGSWLFPSGKSDVQEEIGRGAR